MNDYMKTLVSGMKAYVDNIDNDWNQNDPSASDYIKNRTHYSETKEVELFNKSSLPFEYYEDDNYSDWWDGCKFSLTKGKLYTVIWDGVVYEDLKAFNDEGSVCIGAPAWDATTKAMPFMICTAEWDGSMEAYIATYSSAASHSVIIKTMDEIVHKIDKKYLPEMSNIKNIMDGKTEGSVRTIGAGNGLGYYAFAEGYGTDASGNYSHAEGYETYTSGNYSHVEGYMSSVHADSAHAEGESTDAYGFASHSEGYRTDAHGNYSHTEGTTTRAYGRASHAEGDRTEAYGEYSHAEGTVGGSGTCKFNISGSANATTYNISEWDSSIIVGRYLTYGDAYAKIVNYSLTNLTITLDRTLSSEALTGATVFFGDGAAYGAASHMEGEGSVSTGRASHAEGYYTIANGMYSHSEGYETLAEHCSHAEGNWTTASGNYSHSEGNNTIASGNESHAEGDSTIASGGSSHAEGYSANIILVLTGAANTTTYTVYRWDDKIQVGKYIKYKDTYSRIAAIDKSNLSISLEKTLLNEAMNAITVDLIVGMASGFASHVEGNTTTASGDYSHAEGYYTTATGMTAHAEGHYTTASGRYQHVQGKYNVKDTSNKYAHIVGNGTSNDHISNAHTLDWNGNAWFAGNIKLGGTSQDDENAVEVATKNYVDQKIAEINIETPTEYESIILKSSVSGSTKKFRLTINDDGVLSAEEIVL